MPDMNDPLEKAISKLYLLIVNAHPSDVKKVAQQNIRPILKELVKSCIKQSSPELK